jgi:hypothetical protein
MPIYKARQRQVDACYRYYKTLSSTRVRVHEPLFFKYPVFDETPLTFFLSYIYIHTFLKNKIFFAHLADIYLKYIGPSSP